VVCVMTGGGIASALFLHQARRRKPVAPMGIPPRPAASPIPTTEMTNVQPVVVDAKRVGAVGEYALQDAAQFASAPIVMATPIPARFDE